MGEYGRSKGEEVIKISKNSSQYLKIYDTYMKNMEIWI